MGISGSARVPLFGPGPVDEIDDSLDTQLALFRVCVCLSTTGAGSRSSIRHTTPLSLLFVFHEWGTWRGAFAKTTPVQGRAKLGRTVRFSARQDD
jgi:hypothetical protein